MYKRRFKLEFVDLPDREPFWFDDEEDLDSAIELVKGCPLDDGSTAQLRITEYDIEPISIRRI